MYQQWAMLMGAFCVGNTNAVPCSDIGWPTAASKNDEPVPAKYPDPWDSQGLWEIYKAEDCLVRFQTPGDPLRGPSGGSGANMFPARVTTTQWTATREQVTQTVDSYFGGPGSIMLWLQMNAQAFWYANIIGLNKNYPDTVPQTGLDKENTVLNISEF
jgi:hypothetical protein